MRIEGNGIGWEIVEDNIVWDLVGLLTSSRWELYRYDGTDRVLHLIFYKKSKYDAVAEAMKVVKAYFHDTSK
jgi:hypothetical protein